MQEILVSEQQSYAARKIEMDAQRAALDLEERGMDMALNRLVEVVMASSVQIPQPRSPEQSEMAA